MHNHHDKLLKLIVIGINQTNQINPLTFWYTFALLNNDHINELYFSGGPT